MGATWAGTVDLLTGQGARVSVRFSTAIVPANIGGAVTVQPLGISETVTFEEDRIYSAETMDDNIAGIGLSGARVDGIYLGELQITFAVEEAGAYQIDVSLTGDVTITSAAVTAT